MNAELINLSINGKLLDRNEKAELIDKDEKAELVKLIVVDAGGNHDNHDITWNVVTSDADIIFNYGYVAVNDISRIILTMPNITPASGSKLAFQNRGIAGFQIQQSPSLSILFGNKKTTTGIQGSIKSFDYGDYVEFQFINNEWTATEIIGNFEVL